MPTLKCSKDHMMRICSNCGKIYCKCDVSFSEWSRNNGMPPCPECGSSDTNLADKNSSLIKLKTGSAHL